MHISQLKFLSQAQSIRERAALARDLAQPYRRHQMVWKLFSNSESRDFIYRCDERSPQDMLVVSKQEPDNLDWVQIRTKPYQPQLEAGDKLSFKVCVNPAVDIKQEGSKKSKRVDAIYHAIQNMKRNQESFVRAEIEQTKGQEWLAKRGEKFGFELNHAVVSEYQTHQVSPPKRRSIRFSTIQMHGVLTVSSPSDFCEMLFRGLGREKAFGCGLMLVKRV